MPSGRPLKGESKRVKFTTTVDYALIAVARECAKKQHMTLPALIEKVLDAEIKRYVDQVAAEDVVDALAAETQPTRRKKGK